MPTILDGLVNKASSVYCHIDDGCYVSTCALNCIVYNLKEHIDKENYMLVFGYIRLLEKMGKDINPVESH